MLIRSKAPLRLSFAGGGTDVEPYLSQYGGCVLSTTIDKFAYASLQLRADPRVSVRSLDYDTVADYEGQRSSPGDGKLDLVMAIIDRLKGREYGSGLDLFLHSDAPPGSGLGSSSAIVVATIGLFKHWRHLPLTNYEVAALAYQIERFDQQIKGGKQDQYASTFGGFNFIEFHRDVTIVNPLRIDPDIVNELHYNLLLVYTGKTRLSAGIIDAQMQAYRRGDQEIMTSMTAMKELASGMKNALLLGQLDKFGALMHEAWMNKKKLASAISNQEIDELYEVARRHGAIGGKITGAGGGGYMMLYCEFGKKHLVAAALNRIGAEVVNFNFESTGLQTWRVS